MLCLFYFVLMNSLRSVVFVPRNDVLVRSVDWFCNRGNPKIQQNHGSDKKSPTKKIPAKPDRDFIISFAKQAFGFMPSAFSSLKLI